MKNRVMSSRGGDLVFCLHDCLSLGEVELGLTQLPQPSDNAVEYTGAEKSILSTTICDTKDDEIDRLPILLRILQSSRPLSSIPIFADMTPTSLSGENHDDTTDSTVSEVANRLEDRAALYSATEGVQVVACHLAPAVTRSFGRLPPLSKIHSFNPNTFSNISGSLDISYNTLPLKQMFEKSVSAFGVANNTNPLISSLGKKRKRISDDVVDDNDAPRSKARTGTLLHAEETSIVSEDTQEFVVTKTLHDLIRLTVTSLNQAPFNSVASSNMADDDGDGGGGMLGENMSLSITEHDSILSEAAKSTHQEKQMGACDLASTVASLMHYVPCLRHRHVSVCVLISIDVCTRSHITNSVFMLLIFHTRLHSVVELSRKHLNLFLAWEQTVLVLRHFWPQGVWMYTDVPLQTIYFRNKKEALIQRLQKIARNLCKSYQNFLSEIVHESILSYPKKNP